MLQKYSFDHVWVGNRRCYQIGDGVYPGVTTILSNTKSEADRARLTEWRGLVGEDEAKRILKAACDRGTIIHQLIEDWLQGNHPVTPPAGVKGFWESVEPVLDHISDVQLIEGVVWHSSGFAGSVDCVARWDGELAIIDWKTSNSPKKPQWIKDYFQQTSAYRAAVNEVYELNINTSVVVVALDNQPAQVFKVNANDLDWHWDMFSLRVREFDFDGILAKQLAADDDW
jgi:genome maintenance exonuclease 1